MILNRSEKPTQAARSLTAVVRQSKFHFKFKACFTVVELLQVFLKRYTKTVEGYSIYGEKFHFGLKQSLHSFPHHVISLLLRVH